jgi:UDPglucose 6-dehydrogenase
MRIGIIGYGIVGKATELTLRKFHSPEFEVVLYDIKIAETNMESMKGCDYIFIALPTPSYKDGTCDITLIDETCKTLAALNITIPIIIRSTIFPGTVKRLRKDYDLKVNFMPEFLTQSQFQYDAENPHFIVVGGEEAKQITNDLFSGFKVTVFATDSTTAELFKYTLNTFFATKVIFANQIYDIAQKVGADYSFISDIAQLHPFVGQNHFDIMHSGYRGYGGKCLPKDTKAIAYGFDNSFFKFIDELNTNLMVEGV